jgi:hypothetical protein
MLIRIIALLFAIALSIALEAIWFVRGYLAILAGIAFYCVVRYAEYAIRERRYMKRVVEEAIRDQGSKNSN